MIYNESSCNLISRRECRGIPAGSWRDSAKIKVDICGGVLNAKPSSGESGIRRLTTDYRPDL